MSLNSKTILVYDDFNIDTPQLLGKLYVDTVKGGEIYSFEYDNNWLETTLLSVSMDPDLLPYGGRQYQAITPSLVCLLMLPLTVGDEC